jgi:hypothetical protein
VGPNVAIVSQPSVACALAVLHKVNKEDEPNRTDMLILRNIPTQKIDQKSGSKNEPFVEDIHIITSLRINPVPMINHTNQKLQHDIRPVRYLSHRLTSLWIFSSISFKIL